MTDIGSSQESATGAAGGAVVHAGAGDVDRPELAKSVSKFGFFALAFGSMIGVGWVTAMGGWLESAGPVGSAIAFLVGGALILLIGLCYAEACSMLPVAGGEVAYSYKAFGAAESFGVGTVLAFGYLAVSVFEAISITKVLGYLIPNLEHVPLYTVGDEQVFLTELILAALTTGLITWVNYRGVGMAAKLQGVLILLFGLATIAFVGAGIFGGSFEFLAPGFGAVTELAANGDTVASVDENGNVLPIVGVGAVFAAMSMVMVQAPFWFVGFDTIPQSAEEADDSVSAKSLAGLIVMSIIGASFFYAVVILAVGMSGPWTELFSSDLVAADAFEQAFESKTLGTLVLIAALLGLFTSWNGFFLAGSRVLFALGRGRLINPGLGATHRTFGSPHKAVLFAGAFTFAGACFGRGAMGAFINGGSFCMSIAFLGVTLSVMRLRKICPDLERPFRLPGGPAIPLLSAFGALAIILAMVVPGSPSALGLLDWIVVGVVAALVIVLWVTGAAARDAIPEEDRAGLILGEYTGDGPAG